MLLLRDEESKVFAEKHFDCDVRLCPDMAFCIGPIQPASSRFPVLAMLRSDLEKAGESDLSAYPEIPREDGRRNLPRACAFPRRPVQLERF